MIAWISEDDALAIHADLINDFGGSHGVRDFALLQSALAKPKNLYYYSELPSLNALAASYTYGIVKNHPFIDGNKRVGFAVCTLFLETNGFTLDTTPKQAADIIIALAAGDTGEAELVDFLDNNTHPI
jgi:death on curing protein